MQYSNNDTDSDGMRKKKEERANITKYFNDQQKIGQREWIKYWLNDNSIMRT